MYTNKSTEKRLNSANVYFCHLTYYESFIFRVRYKCLGQMYQIKETRTKGMY